ncbi:putative bark agglutinin LECRPA3-like precursor [Cicer arietinum]|uniref:Bark agglutinin LECRPA3-like precursor n=1 Tax=Cicer arietinum TaxID=3827 RepID=O65756_CICAR|nr:putative bark agglutinin LECRPA3-like precursor [Cicer arietinum]CAA07231.1 vegetative lectin [Cicer arietinum]
MAFSYLNLVLVTLTTLFFLQTTKVKSQKSVSFHITNFTISRPSITLQGTAEFLPNVLLLNDIEHPVFVVGRALYSKPITLWNNKTGKVASFVTSFTFDVQDLKKTVPGHGLVFFLAPSGSEIPFSSDGGNLGVVDGKNAFNRFVGVEFDNFVNSWDPKYSHVGINVNSLISTKTVKWNRVSGELVKVSIVYDSVSTTLTVIVTYKNGQISILSQLVDLKAVLPDTVNIGFSASTTLVSPRQLHNIHSWSFTSTFET